MRSARVRLAFPVALATVLAVAGCIHRPAVVSHPQYTIGPGYEADGVWHYPREDFGYDRTGLASVYDDHAPAVTADGEAYDPRAMAGASPTLQLPCIVQVTNLQTGRQLLLRLNDRGPADPGRILAVTPHAAELLGIPADGAAEVRVTVQQGPSEALADSLGGGIQIKAAPVGGFQATSLAPPPGIAQAGGAAIGETDAANTNAVAVTVPPLRLPVTLTQVPPIRARSMSSQAVSAGSWTRGGRRRDSAVCRTLTSSPFRDRAEACTGSKQGRIRPWRRRMRPSPRPCRPAPWTPRSSCSKAGIAPQARRAQNGNAS
jgi:rare lipoprotein A